MTGFEQVSALGQKRGIKQESKKDYGFGPIDLVWDFNLFPNSKPVRCGFIELREQEGGLEI